MISAGSGDEEAVTSLMSDADLIAKIKAEITRVESGFVAIDPRTGKVRAWVGSRGFSQGPFDHVAKSRRQPGSTFKPFVYGAAIQEGYDPDDLFKDRPVSINLGRGRTWQPASAGGTTEEWYTMKEALAHSRNTIAAQIMADVGPRRVARFAKKLGIRQSELRAVPSLALGTSEVTLLEMVSAYATIAAGGVYREPLLVTHITTSGGDTLASFENGQERVMKEEDAQTLADMMRGTVDYGTGRRIRSVFGVRCDVAGKTGTTQANADGWFLLMHPQLVGGSWVGFNDQRVTFRSDYWGQGAHNALYVVGDFYRYALRQGRLSPNPTLAPFPEEENAVDFWFWARSFFQRDDKDSDSRVRDRVEIRKLPVAPRSERGRQRIESPKRLEIEELAKKLHRARRDLELLLRRIDDEVDIDDLEDRADRVLRGLLDRLEDIEFELDE
jgi:penicillin-binding protein 1A